MAAESTKTNSGTSGLRRWCGYAIRFLVPAAFSALLVVWLFHKVDFKSVKALMSHGVDYSWILLMMLFTVLSHIIRGYRWGMQLRAAGVDCGLPDLCAAVFGNYALNLVVPRIGEVWRSAFISRRKKAPFSTVFGTVLGDRLVDGATVTVLIALTLILTRGPIHEFIRHYHIRTDVLDLVADPVTWCVVFSIAVAAYLLARLGHKSRAVADIDGWMAKMWHGIKVLAAVRGKGLFLLLTLGIWICYFMQVYVCFFSFDFTRALVDRAGSDYGLTAALVAFVFSTLSMAIPSNGGLGPWNLAIIFGLSLFGISNAEGTAFSLVVWCAQSLMLVILGVGTAIYISVTRLRCAAQNQARA